MKRFALFILFVIFTLSSSAQETQPLLQLMSYVPDTAETRQSLISYFDFRANEATLDDFERPRSFEEFIATDPNIQEFVQRWMMTPQSLQIVFSNGEQVPDVMGFDIFDINQTLTFGIAPNDGVVWQGDFDLGTLDVAHEARNYQQTDIEGISAWCGEAGCESGLTLNVNDINNANLFDPRLGRAVPFLVYDSGILVSAPAYTVLESVAQTTQNPDESIAQAEDYRALANAIVDSSVYSGQLIQMVFVPLDSVIYSVFLSESNPEQGVLPLYTNVTIADRQEGDTQITVFALSYSIESQAQAASTELKTRLENFAPTGEVLLDRYEGQATVESRVFDDADTDLYVAVVEVRYPSPTADDSLPAGSFFNWTLRAIFMSEFSPLWITE
jgi:hypothetical protein